MVKRNIIKEAIRLGDLQADQIIDLTNRNRRLQRFIWHAQALLKKRQMKRAIEVLEQAKST
jgi:hypothetical protein